MHTLPKIRQSRLYKHNIYTIVKQEVKEKKSEITIEDIVLKVASYYNLLIAEIHSKTRKREIVQARQISMWFAKKLTKYSLAAIGKEIGNKDHATVLHAIKTVNNLIETDKKIREDIEELINGFNQTK